MMSRIETKALRKTLLGGVSIDSTNLKKSLLGGISVLAFTAMVGASGYALATEVTDTDTILATDAAGLDESDETGAVGVTIDSTGGAITLGADATPSVTVTEAGGATALTLTVTTSGAASGVTFADDVDANGNAGDTIVINVTNDDVTFQGNIQSTVGTTAADINLGSGGADPTLTMTVDTVNNENLIIEATIDAVDAADAITLAVVNTDSGNANTVTFSSAIGSGQAIDALVLGADTTTVFNGTVGADTITINSAKTVQFNDDVTASTVVDFIGDATVTVAANKKIIGDVDASGGSVGTLTFAETTANTTLISGTVGGTNAITALNVNVATGITATLASDVGATTTTLSGVGTLALAGDTTGDVDLVADSTVSVAADKTILGNVDNSSGADGSGTLTFAAITVDTTLVTGDVGATNTLAQVTVDNTGGEAEFIGSVSATAFNASGSGTTVITVAGTFTTLTTDGDFTSGTGLLDVVGTIALTGGDLIIGTGDATLGGASITADNITLAAGSDVTFDGAAAQTVTGPIDGAGDVTITNAAGVTFVNAVGTTIGDIGALTIASTFSGTFESTLDAASIDLDGTLQVEDAVTLTGKLDVGAGSKIILGGGIVDTETAFTVADVDSAGTTTIEVSSTFTSGTIILFDSTADASADLANLTITDTLLVDYTLSANGNDIEITAVAESDADVAATLDVSLQDATAVLNAAAALSASDGTLLDNFDTAIKTGGDDATKAAETVAIQADTLGAGTNVAVSTGGQVIGISSDRLGSLRTGNQFENSAGTGFATGGTSAKYGAWVKPFGNWAEQDNTSGVAGFEALTYGMAFGADTALDDQYRGGVSFAYASSDVEGSGAGQSKADIDSYQLTLYGDFTGKNYYAEASLGYAYNNNTVSRVIDFMGTDTTASGEYGSSQFIASFNTGIPMQMAGTAYFTPTAGLAWTHVISEEYTETGAGGLNQTVDIDDIDVLLGTLGAKMHTQIRYNKGYLVPNIHGGVSYDFIGDNTTATASFTGGGAAFTVAGAEVEQFGGNLGFGFTYESKNFWSIGAGYDADMKSGFISHSALFEARFKF